MLRMCEKQTYDKPTLNGRPGPTCIYVVCIYVFAGRHNAKASAVGSADIDSPSFYNPENLTAFGGSISIFHVGPETKTLLLARVL